MNILAVWEIQESSKESVGDLPSTCVIWSLPGTAFLLYVAWAEFVSTQLPVFCVPALIARNFVAETIFCKV